MRAAAAAAVAVLAIPHFAGAQRSPAGALALADSSSERSRARARSPVDSGPSSPCRTLSTNQRVVRRFEVTGATSLVGAGIAFGLMRTQRGRYYYHPEDAEYGAGMFGGFVGAGVGATLVGGGIPGCGPGGRAARGFGGAFAGTLVGALGANAVTRRQPGRRPIAALLFTNLGQATMATLLEGDC